MEDAAFIPASTMTIPAAKIRIRVGLEREGSVVMVAFV
jgi:hypothetical protein